jgi:hypothetical protein
MAWAAMWAVGGILIGISSVVVPALPWNHFFRVFDAPLPALAIPGAVAGLIFWAVLQTALGRRAFHDVSLLGGAAWGGGVGLLLSLLPAVMIGAGATSPWGITAALIIPFTLLGLAAGAGSLLLARMWGNRRLAADAASPH